jgi:hypothetical protein
MATMNTSLAPPHPLLQPWQALPEPARGATTTSFAAERALAELFPDLQAAADAALADLFPALRLRQRTLLRSNA